MERIDIIRLCFGKALIIGNKPTKVELGKFNEAITMDPHIDRESFGLFETSTPNYSTYYPEVNAEDLKPQEGDFIYPVVRALSEVVVHKKNNPIDFSMNGVLRKSINLLKGQTINVDHETAIGNAIGAIKDVSWQKEYETGLSGIKIPAGINAELKIDGKSNPRLARAMMMDPPAIHSVSATVEFGWAKSHADLKDDEFFSKLGTFDEKGQMYKRNVTKVIRYHELSLVAHGADPFAQLLKDGKEINNPLYAHVTYNSDQEKKIGAQYYFFDMSSDIVKNSAIPNPININEPITTTVMKETIVLLKAIASSAGLTITLADDATAIPADVTATLSSGIGALKTDATALVAEKAKVTDLTTKVTAFETEVAGLKVNDAVALKAFQEKVVTALAADVERKYKLLNATPVQGILDSIKNANLDALKVMDSQYETQLEEKMPLTCTKCKSTSVSRASAKANDPAGNTPGPGQEHIALSNEDTLTKLTRSNKIASRLHGVIEPATK